MWQWLVTSRLGRAVSVVLAALAGLGAAYLKGRSDESSDAEQEAQEQELEAHDRITNADTGAGATDDERRNRLQRMADDWRD